MMMSTLFVFGIVENSMRIMVDGGDIRVAFSLCGCGRMDSVPPAYTVTLDSQTVDINLKKDPYR